MKLSNIENALLHITDIDRKVKKFIYQEWNEKLPDEQKFDIMIKAIKMQNYANHKGEN